MRKATTTGSRGWLAVGIGATLLDMLAALRRPKETVIYRSKLPVGDSVTISHKEKK